MQFACIFLSNIHSFKFNELYFNYSEHISVRSFLKAYQSDTYVIDYIFHPLLVDTPTSFKYSCTRNAN